MNWHPGKKQRERALQLCDRYKMRYGYSIGNKLKKLTKFNQKKKKQYKHFYAEQQTQGKTNQMNETKFMNE